MHRPCPSRGKIGIDFRTPTKPSRQGGKRHQAHLTSALFSTKIQQYKLREIRSSEIIASIIISISSTFFLITGFYSTISEDHGTDPAIPVKQALNFLKHNFPSGILM